MIPEFHQIITPFFGVFKIIKGASSSALKDGGQIGACSRPKKVLGELGNSIVIV
jgi:hypothetical protein